MSQATAGMLIKVAMGHIGYGRAPALLETLLGSCVGVAVWDRSTGLGALAHVILPEGRGQAALAGKYVDTAINALRDELVRQGAMPLTLAAKIAGGATMFGQRLTNDVGRRNCEAAREHLARHRIRLLAEHTGGSQGRVITFELATGELAVRIGRDTVALI